MIWEHPEGITAVLVYSTDLFDAATIDRMAMQFVALLEDAVRAPERRLSELALVPAVERQQLAAWNDTFVDYPRDTCLHEIIEAQVARTPTAVAVTYEGEALTYAELNARANQLAHALAGMGVGREVLVGVSLEHRSFSSSSLLAILKAGGAYVPFDPLYPRERLASMLGDARPAVLLTEERLIEGLSIEGLQVVCLERERETLARQAATNLPRRATPDSLA